MLKHTVYTIVIISLFAVIGPTACGQGEAENHAESYAKNLGSGYRSLGCVGNDSDDDGYVSCTIMHPDGERSGIQCATGFGAGARRTPPKRIPNDPPIGVDRSSRL